MAHIKEEPKYELKKLNRNRINEIVSLEETSMKTDTTFPLTNNELTELFEDGYIAYGYENQSGKLIAKVGFEKVSDKRYELDVCVHPDLQGKGIGKKVMEESLEKILSKNKFNIFLKVHPLNPALNLYTKIGFIGDKDSTGNYKTQKTDNGPRITMDYKNRFI
jgi:ribosomal protein S18 acetylase RimI-like enzyme